MKDFKALIVAHYDFTDKQGRHVKTTKFLVSLEDYGVVEICSELGNDIDLLNEVKVRLGLKGNKFVINSIVK